MKAAVAVVVFLTGCTGLQATAPERQRAECLRLGPDNPWIQGCTILTEGNVNDDRNRETTSR